MVSVRGAKQGKSWKTALLQNGLLGKQHKQCVRRFGQLPWGPHSHLRFLPRLTDQHTTVFGQIVCLLLAVVLTSWLENLLYQNRLESCISLNRDSRILLPESKSFVGLGWDLGNLCFKKKYFPKYKLYNHFDCLSKLKVHAHTHKNACILWDSAILPTAGNLLVKFYQARYVDKDVPCTVICNNKELGTTNTVREWLHNCSTSNGMVYGMLGDYKKEWLSLWNNF